MSTPRRPLDRLADLVSTVPETGAPPAETALEDFCVRMAARGVRLVKNDFVLQPAYGADGFTVDARVGGLVRPLDR